MMLVRFAWPLLLLQVFFVGIWGYETTSLTTAHQHARHAHLFGSVRASLWYVNDLVVAQSLADAPPASAAYLHRLPSVVAGVSGVNGIVLNGTYAACNASAISGAVDSLESLVAVTNTMEDVLLYGSAAAGIDAGIADPMLVGVSSALAIDSWLPDIMLRNGCSIPGMPDDCQQDRAIAGGAHRRLHATAEGAGRLRVASVASAGALVASAGGSCGSQECSRALLQGDAAPFYHGLLGDGLHAAMREMSLLGRRLLDERLVALANAPMVSDGAGGLVASCPPADVNGGSQAATMSRLCSDFLDVGFVYVQARSVAAAAAALDSFSLAHIIMTVIVLLALGVAFLVVLRRSIKKMDGDMKRTRGTLLLFPTDVLADVAHTIHVVDSAEQEDDEDADA